MRFAREAFRLLVPGLVAVAFSAAAPGLVSGQQGEIGSEALRVYLECGGGPGCDSREFRTQLDWINWVRQPQVAQLHIIVSGQGTGGGGRSYIVDFIGLEDLEGQDDQLTYTSLGTDVRDEEVRGLGRVLYLGISRYALLAGFTPPVDVVRIEDEGEDLTDRLVTSDQVDDPWDFWVFRLDFNMDANGESTRRRRGYRGGFDASRTTTTWKFEFEAGGNWSRNEIDLDSITTFVDTRRNWDVEAFMVYTLADHWSLGAGGLISASTRSNQDFNAQFGPRIEWSYWPYEEAPRRSFRAQYHVELRYFDYEERTIYNRTWETRPVHWIEFSLNRRETWGSMFTNFTASQYLHNTDFYRLQMGGFVSFRLVRGLDFNISGGASWIRDQLFLSASGASPEEILLQRRRLASDFDWNFRAGFGFQFGSIFNNVVNNRF